MTQRVESISNDLT